MCSKSYSSHRQRLSFFLLAFFLLFPFLSRSQSVGINTSGAAPDPSAMLDVAASDKGILIPRVQLDDVNTQAPISAAPVEGLLIYNATGSEPAGYYYWDGTQWIAIATGSSGINSNFVLNGSTLELTDPGGTLTADLSSLTDSTDNDSVVGNEYNSSLNLTGGGILELTDPGGTLTEDLSGLGGGGTDLDSVANNELITDFTLSGDLLEVSDSGGTYSVDLSSYTDSTDNDSVIGNEYNSSFTLSSDQLSITDPGNTYTVDLSPYTDSTDNDSVVGNEYNTGLSLSNDSLLVTDNGGTLKQDLSSLGGSGYWDRDASNGYLFPSNIGDRVGVGTSTPARDMEVVDADGNGTAAIEIGGSSGDRIYIGSVEYIEDAGANELGFSDDIIPIGTEDIGQSGDEWEDLYLNGAIFDNTGTDGTAGQVLTSTGNGIEWQDAASAANDSDWQYDSSDSTMLENVGTPADCVLVGDTAGTPNYDFHFAVYNGTSSDTRVGMGSVEYFIDGGSTLYISDDFEPETDALEDLGGTSNRWSDIYGVDYHVDGVLNDNSGVSGNSDEVLTSTGTGVEWKNIDSVQTGDSVIGHWSRDTANNYLFPTNISDQVGVGTNTPARDLEVEDADGNGTASIEVGSSSGDRIYIGSVEYIEDGGANELGFSDDIIPVGTENIGASGDEWEDLYLNGAIFDNTGTDGTSGEVLTSTGNGIEWQAAGGSYWDRDAGNGYVFPSTLGDKVGIGTNTPSTYLHVDPGSNSDDGITVGPFYNDHLTLNTNSGLDRDIINFQRSGTNEWSLELVDASPNDLRLYGGGEFEVDADFNVTGAKNFKIDHPAAPEEKHLYHAAVESNKPYNKYHGRVKTDEDGVAVVELPEYVKMINKNYQYNLTVIGDFAQAIVEEEFEDDTFVIRTDKPGVEVSWTLIGERNDEYMRNNPYKAVREKDDGPTKEELRKEGELEE